MASVRRYCFYEAGAAFVTFFAAPYFVRRVPLQNGEQSDFVADFVEASLQAEFHNYEIPLRGVLRFVACPLLSQRGTAVVLERLRAAPSPTRSPIRATGRPNPCKIII